MTARTCSLTLALSACLFGVLFAPRSALACSCLAPPMASVSWPLEGAKDVATDTPIVVWRYGFTGNLASSLPVLAAEGGEVVSLLETTRIVSPGDVCASSEYLFLRPVKALRPGTRYTLGFPADVSPQLPPPNRATFQVGDKAFEPEPQPSADILLLSVFTEPACTRSDCNQLHSLRVDLGALPKRPLWLQLHSDAPKYGDGNWVFLPSGNPGARTAVQQSVALSPNDGCIDVRIYGVEGRALFSERHCKPDRCVVNTRVTVSTCGGLPFSEVDAALVPAQSCEHPPVFDAVTGSVVAPAVRAPEPEPMPVVPPETTSNVIAAAAGGPAVPPIASAPARPAACSVFHVGSSRACMFGLWQLALLGLLRSRRRL